MELTNRKNMARFQTFWIQMRKNKPLDESRKTGQITGTKMTFYSRIKYIGVIMKGRITSKTHTFWIDRPR
ncbi:hypothetical protein Hanom_Chr03g00222121 [Helianthus anomalus]